MINQIKHKTFFRAKVVDNNDPQKLGRVMVWIPDLMPLIPENEGLWANPANNPIGGRNDRCSFIGSSFIPPIDSWVWIFFEHGCLDLPYYIGSLDLNSKIVAECQSDNKDKWVIFKSKEGRCLVVSDDPDDARVEITGKKRMISDPPSGDTESVYEIDNNQTTILFDERGGKEKILIRTYKGDFFHIDIDDSKLHISFASDIEIKSGGKINIHAQEMNITAVDNINLSSDNINMKCDNKMNMRGAVVSIQSNSNTSIKSSSMIALDGKMIQNNCGSSVSSPSVSPKKANPEGERET